MRIALVILFVVRGKDIDGLYCVWCGLGIAMVYTICGEGWV